MSDPVYSGAAWTNPNNATTSNNVRATVSLAGNTGDDCDGASECSQLLRCSGFGFSLPADARVDGIQARFEVLRPSADAAPVDVETRAVRVVRGGVPIGGAPVVYPVGDTSSNAEHSPGYSSWPNPEAVLTYGSTTETWLEYWTPAQINDSAFGVGIQVGNRNTTTYVAEVDSVEVCVSYLATGATPTATPTPVATLVFNLDNTGGPTPAAAGCPAPFADPTGGGYTGQPQDFGIVAENIAYFQGTPRGNAAFCVDNVDFPTGHCDLTIGRDDCGSSDLPPSYGGTNRFFFWDNVSPVRPILAINAPGIGNQARLWLTNTVVGGAFVDADLCGDTADDEGPTNDVPVPGPYTRNPCLFCLRIRQDPRPQFNNFVDCDGGTNVDVALTINSNVANTPPPAPPTPVVGTPNPGRTPGTGTEAGHSVDRALAAIQILQAANCPGPTDASWNAQTEVPIILSSGVAHTNITSPQNCSGALSCVMNTTTGRKEVAVYGRQLSGIGPTCGTFGSGTGGALVGAAAILDQYVSDALSVRRTDLAVVFRLKQNP